MSAQALRRLRMVKFINLTKTADPDIYAESLIQIEDNSTETEMIKLLPILELLQEHIRDELQAVIGKTKQTLARVDWDEMREFEEIYCERILTLTEDSIWHRIRGFVRQEI